jgi:hypothetical protein
MALSPFFGGVCVEDEANFIAFHFWISFLSSVAIKQIIINI